MVTWKNRITGPVPSQSASNADVDDFFVADLNKL